MVNSTKKHDFVAVSDRILIIPDNPNEWTGKPSNTGTIVSVGNVCKIPVSVGDKIGHARGAHPIQEEYTVLREEQIYAIIK